MLAGQGTVSSFKTETRVSRRSAEGARRSRGGKKEREETSAVKHKTAVNYCSGRPNQTQATATVASCIIVFYLDHRTCANPLTNKFRPLSVLSRDLQICCTSRLSSKGVMETNCYDSL